MSIKYTFSVVLEGNGEEFEIKVTATDVAGAIAEAQLAKRQVFSHFSKDGKNIYKNVAIVPEEYTIKSITKLGVRYFEVEGMKLPPIRNKEQPKKKVEMFNTVESGNLSDWDTTGLICVRYYH